jgi:hypothetical protein
MHRLMKIPLTSSLMFCLSFTSPVLGQGTKKFKDRAEFELWRSTQKQRDPRARLEVLLEWKRQYPETDFKEDRLLGLTMAHKQLGHAEETLEAAKELLAIDRTNPSVPRSMRRLPDRSLL